MYHIYIYIYIYTWHLVPPAVALPADTSMQTMSWKVEALVEEVPVTPYFYQAGIPTQVTSLLAPPHVTFEPL